MIHIHSDVEILVYFTDKNGLSAFNKDAIGYAMQGENIVQVFYNRGNEGFGFKNAEQYYIENKYKENLPIIYFWNQEIWDKLHKKNL